MDALWGSLVAILLILLSFILVVLNPARWWYTATVAAAVFAISLARLTCEATGSLMGLESCRAWELFQLGAVQLNGLMLFLVPIIPEGEFVHVLVCTTLMLMLWVIFLQGQTLLAWVFVLVVAVFVTVAWAYYLIELCIRGGYDGGGGGDNQRRPARHEHGGRTASKEQRPRVR